MFPWGGGITCYLLQMTKVKFSLLSFEKELGNTGESSNGGNPPDPRPNSKGLWRDVVRILMLVVATVGVIVGILGYQKADEKFTDQTEEVRHSPPDSLARSLIPK